MKSSRNKLSLFVLSFIVFTIPNLSYGTAILPCETPKKLDKISKDCSDNHHYIKAGTTCLKSVEAFILQTTQLPLSEIKKKNFKSTEISIQKRRAVRRALKKAQNRISKYNTSIFYPEEFDAPTEMIGNASEFLKSQVCYSQANKTLKEIRRTMGSYLAKFKAPKTKSLMPKDK